MEPNSPTSIQKETNNQKPQSQKKVMLLVAIGVLVVIVIALAAYYVMKRCVADDDTINTANNVTANAQNSSHVANNATNNTTGSVASSEMQTYTNTQYKFSLTYPKTYQDYGNCDDVKKVRDAIDNNQPRPTVSDVAVKVFEVPGKNKLYLAPEKTIEIKMYQVGETGIYNFDYSSCKIVDTTLDLLTHWDDNLGDVTIVRPVMLEDPMTLFYKTVQSDADFVTLYTDKVYSLKDGCTVTKTPDTQDATTLTIGITGGEACYGAGVAPTLYRYSTASKTAVLTSTFQVLPFGLKEDFIQFTK